MKLLRIPCPSPWRSRSAAARWAGCSAAARPRRRLLTLTPQRRCRASIARSASAGEAVTIAVPVIGKELRTDRVPAQVGHMEVGYIKDLQWVDTPDRLFQDLLAETVRRTTGRVVLDPRQATLDPGTSVSGQLHTHRL